MLYCDTSLNRFNPEVIVSIQKLTPSYTFIDSVAVILS